MDKNKSMAYGDIKRINVQKPVRKMVVKNTIRGARTPLYEQADLDLK